MKPLLYLLLILLTGVLLTCSSEETRQPIVEAPAPTIISCSFNPLDGECSFYSDNSVLCSMGKCSEGDCITGKGTFSYSNGSFLEATFKKGKIVEGSGSYNKCGDKFVGILSDTTSKGMHTYRDGSIYEGTILNGNGEGYGIFKDSYGVYNGNWKSNQRNGKGVQTSKNGSEVYDGNWKSDQRDGKGVQTLKDENKVYIGTWKDGIKEGKFLIKDLETKTERVVTYINGKDDEQRERERLYAIEQKRKEQAELAEMRSKASTNQMWHNKFITCDVFSIKDICDTRIPIIFKYRDNTGSIRACLKNFETEKIYFQCQIKGNPRTALYDTAITIFTDQNGNCSPKWYDLCD